MVSRKCGFLISFQNVDEVLLAKHRTNDRITSRMLSGLSTTGCVCCAAHGGWEKREERQQKKRETMTTTTKIRNKKTSLFQLCVVKENEVTTEWERIRILNTLSTRIYGYVLRTVMYPCFWCYFSLIRWMHENKKRKTHTISFYSVRRYVSLSSQCICLYVFVCYRGALHFSVLFLSLFFSSSALSKTMFFI